MSVTPAKGSSFQFRVNDRFVMVSTTDLFVLLMVLRPGIGIKIWIQNTGIDNPINWDLGHVPRTCDRISFPLLSDVATYWNIRNITISGLRLSKTGEILFPRSVKLGFRDEAKCSEGRELKYTRTGVKGWLDGDNWAAHDNTKWVPHTERVPCTGEGIWFPSDNTIAVQLPSILLPMSDILFGKEIFKNDDWNRFLTSELGFTLFKGYEESRGYLWRTDTGCFNKKKCTCNRDAYTVRDGMYKEVSQKVFQEAICLYAMPKCKPVDCYSPIVPEGHCCGICGALLKLEDKTEDGYNLNDIKSRVRRQLKKSGLIDKLQTYVGRTSDGNIQIVVLAENSDDTVNSHGLANAIARNLSDYKFHSRLTSHLSGLPFSKYLFNSISGIVFGTFLAVVSVFALIIYLYVILPHKTLNLGKNKPFVFARFDNTLNEDGSVENLEVGIEPGEGDGSIQAFDNPMCAKNMDIIASKVTSFTKEAEDESSFENKSSERTGTQEYHNLVYEDLQKEEEGIVFNGVEDESEKINDESGFTEIKL